MANEMKHMKTTVEPWGEKRREFFWLYSLVGVPILDATATKVVPQPTAPIPVEAKCTQAEIDAIRAGDAVFQLVTLTQSAGESNAAFMPRARADYAARGVWYIQRFRDMYEQSGIHVDA